MTETEGKRAAGALRMMNRIIEKNRDANDREVQLEMADTRLIEEARDNLKGMIDEALTKAQARLERVEGWLDESEDTDDDAVQTEMFGPDGRPTSPADANGKVMKPTRAVSFIGDLDENPVVATSETPNSALASLALSDGTLPAHGFDFTDELLGMAPGVKRGILQSLRDGAGKDKAIKLVTEKTGLAKDDVAFHFADMQDRGIIRREGRNWITEVPEAQGAGWGAGA